MHEATRGAFPELWRQPDLPSHHFYQSYLATYLERDVRQLLNVRSLRDFERFIRILASRSAQELNRSTLSRQIGVSVNTISEWISVLEASNVIAILEPWYQNFSKRLVKTPKIYFRDTGLLCYLLGVDADSLAQSPFTGAVWETWLYSELRKANALRKTPFNLWFYRDQRQREIDFLLEGGGHLHFLETKATENLKRGDANVMLTVREEMDASTTPLRPGHCWVVGNTEAVHPLGKQAQAVNLPYLLDWLFPLSELT